MDAQLRVYGLEPSLPELPYPVADFTRILMMGIPYALRHLLEEPPLQKVYRKQVTEISLGIFTYIFLLEVINILIKFRRL